MPALSSTLHEHIDITTLILMLVLMLVAPAITDFDARPPPCATIACDAVIMMNFRIERDYPKLLLNAKNLVLCTYVTLPKVGGSDQDEIRRLVFDLAATIDDELQCYEAHGRRRWAEPSMLPRGPSIAAGFAVEGHVALASLRSLAHLLCHSARPVVANGRPASTRTMPTASLLAIVSDSAWLQVG